MRAQKPVRFGVWRSWVGLLSDYLTLTKPRIILLLLVTALGGAILAAGGLPPGRPLLTVLVGGALAAGGASALNHYLEQDLDRIMPRTQRRPVASGRVRRGALAFGLILNAVAFLLLWWGANLLSALLALSGSLFYVLVYTLLLKRSTAQNIVIGGAAGAVPPLVAWAAVTGGLDLPALYLFALIFFWTPPHFWSLALLLRSDYALARVPMLPVVAGEEWARRAIFLYVLQLNTIALLFFLAVPDLGLLYLSSALLLGGGYLFFAGKLLLRPGQKATGRLYRYSLLYLALLFLAIMVDGSLA